MNDKIKLHLQAYCEKKGWATDDDTLQEVLTEAKEIYSENKGSHRWYDDLFNVVEIDGMKIGFNWYYVTGDTSIRDMDLSFDWGSVCEVEAKEKTVTYYERAV